MRNCRTSCRGITTCAQDSHHANRNHYQHQQQQSSRASLSSSATPLIWPTAMAHYCHGQAGRHARNRHHKAPGAATNRDRRAPSVIFAPATPQPA
eukprot:CAMPEP_0204390818 /NCGR_PEP_ID=MMETSP0469-20131031/60925_1 /ASSEMBLY_ACC=CAM_ASM_000384 /TAXON_ID=2969 /ORGANISM="Oxyrrhis marina" /LENGTH=94 /DNA_ID=CAMNT_0051384745 /DNA_START=72 /DNA_END=356 /DNA_ORIENTATION=-